MVIRVLLALLIVAFSWSQAVAHDHYDDDWDHDHHHNGDDWEEAWVYVGIGAAVVAGLTLLGAIIFSSPPPPPHLVRDAQKTPPKMILEGSPTGIRVRF